MAEAPLRPNHTFLPDSSTVFTNCRLCLHGSLTLKNSALVVSNAKGRIQQVLHSGEGVDVAKASKTERGIEAIDLNNAILAPGFLELQTNGMRGFHFTHFEDEASYAAKIEEIARYLPSQGGTGFWATIPTVESGEFKKVEFRAPSFDCCW